ncbi:type VII secretion integral membrane protein EccD [Streptomyces sp. B6B3]|uniref:type VII secretion integral membrane protein EccD n=1 Tax=Streptomyces sp. B6B3 TaxID=3153570 RepID=UPI00325F544D
MVSATDAAARARTRLSRVTLAGEGRRIDLLVPAEEPIGELLPDVLRMLDDHPVSRPAARRLVTADGAVLAQDETLAGAGIEDGAVLRLVRQEETPAAPVVHDVADAAAEDLDVRGWRWDAASTRAWAAGVATLAMGLAAALLARGWYGADAVAPWLVAAALASAGSGVLAARVARQTAAGAVLILLGGVLGGVGAWLLADDAGEDTRLLRLVTVGLAVVATLGLLGAFAGLGRSGLVGAGAVGLLLGGWALATVLTQQDDRGGVVLGVTSVLMLGLLPRYALMTSGLTRLDDARAGGASVSRHRVDTALAATHRGLALAVVATAASAAVAGWLAVGERAGSAGAPPQGPTWWSVTVTVLLALILVSRARAYPLAVEVVALLAAGAVLAVRLVVVWAGESGEPAGPLVVVCAVALLPLALHMVHPPDHVRVRLRRIMNMVESLAVVVLIPVAVGAFGVYGRLLDTF